jgi:hypothetical protein
MQTKQAVVELPNNIFRGQEVVEHPLFSELLQVRAKN